MVGRNTHINLQPLGNSLEGCREHDAVKQAKVGPEDLAWEILPDKLLSPAASHEPGDVVRALGEQDDGVLI